MNTGKTWCVRIVGLLLLLGVPYLVLAGPSLFGGDGVSAITGASRYVFDPNDVDGEYVVLINRALHEKQDTVQTWSAFFSGENVPVIMDDISCLVAAGDTAGRTFAELCQARLPENQMRLKSVDGLLMISKATHGKFDVIIMSKALADAYGAQSLGENDGMARIETGGGSHEKV